MYQESITAEFKKLEAVLLKRLAEEKAHGPNRLAVESGREYFAVTGDSNVVRLRIDGLAAVHGTNQGAPLPELAEALRKLAVKCEQCQFPTRLEPQYLDAKARVDLQQIVQLPHAPSDTAPNLPCLSVEIPNTEESLNQLRAMVRETVREEMQAHWDAGQKALLKDVEAMAELLGPHERALVLKQVTTSQDRSHWSGH